MRLLQTLGRYIDDNIHYSIFRCPNCDLVVIRQTSNGKLQKCCGCTPKAYKHGDALKGKITSLYRIWVNMKSRCQIKSSSAYPWYGAKGIKIDIKWLNYSEFKRWAISSGYRKGLSLSREDHSKNYTPDNCLWTTKQENCKEAANRRWKGKGFSQKA